MGRERERPNSSSSPLSTCLRVKQFSIISMIVFLGKLLKKIEEIVLCFHLDVGITNVYISSLHSYHPTKDWFVQLEMQYFTNKGSESLYSTAHQVLVKYRNYGKLAEKPIDLACVVCDAKYFDVLTFNAWAHDCIDKIENLSEECRDNF